MNNNKITEKQLDKALRSARASLEIEGFKVTTEHERLLRMKLKGEITEEEYQKKMLSI